MWKHLIIISLIRPVSLQDNIIQMQSPTPPVTSRFGGGPEGTFDKFTLPTTVRRIVRRTTSASVSFKENCDYLAFYCLKAYKTGAVCGRTVNYNYYTFKNYCMLDYVNCMERYDLWQAVYMGQCMTFERLTEYAHYPYDDDFFLDQYYIIEDV